jgi:hypothetical protein
MKKSLLVAAIFSLSSLGSALASEQNQDMQFMGDQKLQEINGALLAKGFTKKDALDIVFETSKYKLTAKERNAVSGSAARMIYVDKEVYDKRTFSRKLKRFAARLQRNS